MGNKVNVGLLYFVGLVLSILFIGCVSSDSETAFNETSPKNIETNKIYKLTMYSDEDESYNRSYLKFIPRISAYHTIHIGTNDNQDLDIKVYSDNEYSKSIDKTTKSNVHGEYLTLNAKKDQIYYIMIENYDNETDIDFNILISQSLLNTIYTKETPLVFTLDSYKLNILSTIGYDLLDDDKDDNENSHYIQINSNINRTLVISTKVTDNAQDLDIKVYLDNNYSNEIYTSASNDTTNDDIKVNFYKNTTYYILINNFTNDDETDFLFSIE